MLWVENRMHIGVVVHTLRFLCVGCRCGPTCVDCPNARSALVLDWLSGRAPCTRSSEVLATRVAAPQGVTLGESGEPGSARAHLLDTER